MRQKQLSVDDLFVIGHSSEGDSSRNKVKIHGQEAFEGMRRAGLLAAETLDFITQFVKVGVTTGALNDLCHDFILNHDAIPAPLGYRGFPKSICTSVNEVICHGIPSQSAELKDGDILNIDVTVILDGWYGDTSRMYLLGDTRGAARKLVKVTYEAMMRGIEVVKPGASLGDIGHAIQSFAELNGFSVVTDFCGHGLGRIFHDAPSVLHYGQRGTGLILKPGMFFTIEPMINLGAPDSYILDDNWTAKTVDGKLSAQFEHSVGVTETGVEIFTLSPKGWHKPPYD